MGTNNSGLEAGGAKEGGGGEQKGSLPVKLENKKGSVRTGTFLGLGGTRGPTSKKKRIKIYIGWEKKNTNQEESQKGDKA